MTYFNLLPTDLIKQYFLDDFTKEEIYALMPRLKTISPFNRLLFNDDIIGLWRDLWKRDISEYRIPDDLTYDEYYGTLANYYIKDTETWTETWTEFGPGDIRIFRTASAGHEKLLYSLIKTLENFGFALIFAASGGYVDIVRILLYSTTGKTYIDALNQASKNGHLGTVILLLKHGAFSHQSLNYAAMEEHTDVMNLLIKYGMNNYSSALEWAAAGGRPKVVEMLLPLVAKQPDVYYESILRDIDNARVEKVTDAADKLFSKKFQRPRLTERQLEEEQRKYEEEIKSLNNRYRIVINLLNEHKNQPEAMIE